MTDKRHHISRRGVLAAGLGVGAAAFTPGLARADGSVPVAASTSQIGQRLYYMSFATNHVLSGRVSANVLVPASYASHPHRRYPALYLMHGSDDNYNGWIDNTDIQSFAANYEIVIVMGEAQSGWYLDHPYTHLNGRTQDWELIHSNSLVLAAQSRFRLINTQAARAMAGPSMGGYGAFMIGFRHPTLVSAVSSYSGALDIRQPTWRGEMYTDPANNGEQRGAIFGRSPGREGSRLTVVNPAQNPRNLMGKRIRMYAGDAGGDVNNYEYQAYQSANAMNAALRSVGVPAVSTGTGRGRALTIFAGGTHNWSYWQTAFHRDLPGMVGFLTRAQG